VFTGKRFHPVDGELKLKVYRSLRPQRPVVVEHRDSFSGIDERGACHIGHGFHELDNRLLRRAIVPGCQRIDQIAGCTASR